MRLATKLRLTCLAGAVLLLPSCKPGDLTPNDYEAMERGRQYWAAMVSKCGDYWYGRYAPASGTPSSLIFQFEDFFGTAISFPGQHDLTAEDRARGVEWKGEVYARLIAFRTYEQGKWSAWRNVQFFTADYPRLRKRPAMKINGGWEIGAENSDKLIPLPCDQVPPSPN